MYNLLIALAIGAAGFSLGALSGDWYYGLFPSMLAFGIAYFLLARRSTKQLEAISMEIQSDFQKLQAEMEKLASKPPTSMRQAKALQTQAKGMQDQAVEAALEKFASALPLGKWQFLIERQIRSQMGALEYARQDFVAAREHLERAWVRNWQAMAMLACIDVRDGDTAAALARFEKAQLLGKRESLMWAVYIFVLLEAKDRDGAMQAIAEARKILPESDSLKALQQAIANDKMGRFKWDRTFGQAWYQFFPEQAVNAQRPGGPGAPSGAPRPPGHLRGGKTFPHPRR